MGRKIGWSDETIQGGYGDDSLKDRRYKGLRGQKHVVRVMTEAEVFRVHVIDDVLDAAEDGEPRVFYMNCSQTWDDEAEDWTGKCMGCEGDYDVQEKYIAGVLLLGVQKGKKGGMQKIDPENSPHYWTFGADKYRKLSNIYLELQRAKKKRSLKQVELTIDCGSKADDEKFQKLDINVAQGDDMTTRDHVAAWKEDGPDLIEAAMKVESIAVQKRKLKKKKRKREDEDDVIDDEEEEEEEKPRRAKKKGPRRTKKKASRKKKEPEPEEEEEGDDEEEEDEVGEDDLDDLLSEIE